MMTDLIAIDLRKSRRTYIMQEIEKEKADVIYALVKAVNTKSKLNIAFVENGAEAFKTVSGAGGIIKNVPSFLILKGKKTDGAFKEKAGYYGERLVIEITKLGLGSCWMAVNPEKAAADLQIPADEEAVCLITLGKVSDELNFREKLIYRATHRKRRDLVDLYVSDGEPAEWFLNGMRAVLKAPSSMNTQKYKFTFAGGTVRAASTAADSSYAMVDLGIAKQHFEIGAGCGYFERGDNALFIPPEKPEDKKPGDGDKNKQSFTNNGKPMFNEKGRPIYH